MSDTEDQQVTVFISYSRKDKPWVDRLKVHLAPLRRRSNLDYWDDSRIKAGAKWRDEIRSAIEKADIAILIISADFLASDFIDKHELPPLLKAAEEEGAIILPIIVSPVFLANSSDLSQYQSVNDLSEPLVDASVGRQEATFVKVAETIFETLPRGKLRKIAAARETLQEETFLNAAMFNRLIKIGDWIFDKDAGRIIGSGVHAYLVSREEYGELPFVIDTT